MRPSDAEGVERHRELAEQGDARAQYELARCLVKGKGAAGGDPEAADWLRKAAEQGLTEAMFHLARMCRHGEGVPRDYGEAVRWFRRAAKQGLPEAQYGLGDCYHLGHGVPENKGKAAHWFREAAKQGFAPAQYRLGVCYRRGEGVRRSRRAAREWIRKAADQGYGEAERAAALQACAGALRGCLPALRFALLGLAVMGAVFAFANVAAYAGLLPEGSGGRRLMAAAGLVGWLVASVGLIPLAEADSTGILVAVGALVFLAGLVCFVTSGVLYFLGYVPHWQYFGVNGAAAFCAGAICVRSAEFRRDESA